jgi:LysM repeat protein
MRNYCLYLSIVLVLLLNSCGSSRRTARTASPSGATASYVTEYINKYSAVAVSEMQRTGIPASITLAQGMLESGYGRSTLATKGNNHFGIKCHSTWTGARIYHDDNRKGECFRAYNSALESYRDHSEFLVNGSRYSELFKLSKTDYRAWAHGLKKAGYATDPKYAQLLIGKIEEYGLHAYDTGMKMAGVPGEQVTAMPATVSQTKPDATAPSPVPSAGPPKPPATTATTANKVTDTSAVQKSAATETTREAEAPIKVISLSTGSKPEINNGVEYIIAAEGDTFESLAVKHQLLAWEIIRYNDLNSGTPIQPGQVLYLQLKRTRAGQGNQMHTVIPGETMHSISQKYAIKLSSLYKMNVMEEGTECKPGQKLRLR